MIKFGFHIINQQQLYASSEVYSCCRFTRALALYPLLCSLTRVQLFTRCIAALPVLSTLLVAPLPYPPAGLPTHPNSLSLANRAPHQRRYRVLLDHR